MIDPVEIYASSDMVRQCGEEAENLEFDRAIELRDALQLLLAKAKTALANVEMDMVRQLEHQAKKINGITYTRRAVKTFKTDHERLLSVAYQRALADATQQDGNIDWEALGEYYGNIIVSLYLAPSTKPKVSGLEHLGVGKKQFTDERITGWQLGVYGEED